MFANDTRRRKGSHSPLRETSSKMVELVKVNEHRDPQKNSFGVFSIRREN